MIITIRRLTIYLWSRESSKHLTGFYYYGKKYRLGLYIMTSYYKKV